MFYLRMIFKDLKNAYLKVNKKKNEIKLVTFSKKYKKLNEMLFIKNYNSKISI